MFGLMMILSILFWVALAGGGFYVAMRFVRAFEHRSLEREELRAVREELGRLQDAMDETNREVERLTEAQRFTMKLLTDRSGPRPGEPPE
jgi:hypothetical protein